MTRTTLPLLAATAAALLLAGAGCSILVSEKLDEKPDEPTDSGTGTTDGGPGTDGGPDTDAGPAVSVCDGASDGTLCTVSGVSGMFICVDEMCSVSACGDGVVDGRLDEQCDDGNEVSGDGCEPFTCVFTCSADDDCIDTNVCNGTESCSPDAHVCEPGEMADDGSTCARDDGSDGVCRAGACVGAGCGNGAPDAGEECDDGNLEDGDGCDADCTWTCETDEECLDGDVCNGEESCDTDAHLCSDGTPLECSDDDACTEDTCDPTAGCVFDSSPFDMDEDTHFAESCGGDDCDDTDRTIYEGAEELCDGLDNDCDGSTDESAPYWYVDCDRDTYAATTAGSMQSCVTPSASPSDCDGGGWTSTRPLRASTDCDDSNGSYRPGQDGWFDESSGDPGFDYNCDGAETRQYGYDDGTSKFCGKLFGSTSCTGLPYYDVRSEPDCGSRVTLNVCRKNILTGSCYWGTADGHIVACH